MLRVAVIRLSRPKPHAFGKWPYVASNGRKVEVTGLNGDVEDVTGGEAAPPAGTVRLVWPWEDDRLSVLVEVRVEAGPPTLIDDRLMIPSVPRLAAEAAINEYSEVLAVLHQCRRLILSPLHVAVGMRPTSPSEVKRTEPVVGLHRGESYLGSPPRVMPSGAPHNIAPFLRNRLDGLALLANSLSEGTTVGRSRELFRLFERAFRVGPSETTKPLYTFLSTHPRATELAYTLDEVRHWLENLRASAMHADRRESYARSSHIEPYLGRMEQAAYDALFNKEHWRHKSSLRRQQLDFASGIPSSGPTLSFVNGSSILFQWVDLFSVYPLEPSANVTLTPEWIWRLPGQEEQAPVVGPTGQGLSGAADTGRPS